MKTLIIEDHLIVQMAIKKLVQDYNPNAVLDICSTGEDALAKLNENDFDLAILDLKIPDTDSFYLIQEIKQITPECKILIFSSGNPEVYASKCIKSGVDGYVHKSATPLTFTVALRTVLNGGVYLPTSVKNSILEGVDLNPFSRLSNRELEVTIHLVQGKSVKEICQLTGLESSTIGTQKSRVFEKLEVDNLVDLYKLAVQHNLVD